MCRAVFEGVQGERIAQGIEFFKSLRICPVNNSMYVYTYVSRREKYLDEKIS